jgi:hypothetical protein
MPNALESYLRSVLSFPKRSTSYLRSMRTSGLVCGIAWLVVVVIWVDSLRTTLLVILALGWLLQAALVHRELRRRERDPTST